MTVAQKKFTPSDYKSDVKPVWCPGCGDYGVYTSLTNAMSLKNYNPWEIALISGIGCSSRTPSFLKVYGFHTVHGRALAVASGLKLARPDLHVIVVGGDGDGISIGGGHFIHACRRNIELPYIMMNNSIYGQTKGQVSPTTLEGTVTRSTPYGALEAPLNPSAVAIVTGASFVARGFAGNPTQLTELIVKAFEHKGFAFVEAVSPCVAFNNTYASIKGRAKNLDQSHDVTSKIKALDMALKEDPLYFGVLYDVKVATLNEKIKALQEKMKGKTTLEELLTSSA
ncbi:MAG: thiamine pyrophosphate-dependent enzyme [Promethearchaeati archaeon SRVP18_Atabeyarchaeia-1]